jgi:hypothetical protein
MGRGALPGERANNSLADVEKALAQASDQAKFIGARRLHWDDQKRGEARERVGELSEGANRFCKRFTRNAPILRLELRKTLRWLMP